MDAIPQIANDAACPGDTLPYLIVRLNRQDAAIPVRHVRAILMTPKVVPIPGAPPHVRGVIHVRGEVMQVMDLRLRLGMPHRMKDVEDLLEVLRAREEDHHNWIRELDASVRERRPFKLARDPHQCKFGKWYDTYQTDNRMLQLLWGRFNQPHRQIHAIADVVSAHMERGEADEALALIEHTRTTVMAALTGVFAEARQAILEFSRELVIVLDHGAKALAITVDEADVVETIREADMMELPVMLCAEGAAVISRTARRAQTDDLLLVVDTAKLFPDESGESERSARAA